MTIDYVSFEIDEIENYLIYNCKIITHQPNYVYF
jgi:hypothetical protein